MVRSGERDVKDNEYPQYGFRIRIREIPQVIFPSEGLQHRSMRRVEKSRF